MKNPHRLLVKALTPAALIGACIALAPACSSDSAPNPGTDGGPETGGASAGGKATGGGGGAATGGKATGGTSSGGMSSGGAGTGGKATGGASTGGASHADAGSDASAPDASPDAATAVDGGPGPADVVCADSGVPTSALLVAGTAFCSTCTTSEVAAVNLTRGCVLGRKSFADSDIAPRASGGHGFVVERNNGILSVLDATAKVTASVNLHHADAGTVSLNPHDVVYVKPASGPAKAYVSLYNASQIAVVDLDAEKVTSYVDLSRFHDASDADGSADPDVGFYDATTGRVYFVLQRIDLYSGVMPDYVLACPPVPSLLVAIDTTTDQLVDLNGAAADVGLPLSLVSAADVAVDTAGRRAILVANGCGQHESDGGTTRVLDGVESVNLDTLATTVLFKPTSQDFFNHVVLLGSDSTLLQSFDDLGTNLWNKWAPSSATLGAALSGVPDSAVLEGPDSVVGVTFQSGKPQVERYKVSTQVATRVVAAPWVGDYTFVAGVALVK